MGMEDYIRMRWRADTASGAVVEIRNLTSVNHAHLNGKKAKIVGGDELVGLNPRFAIETLDEPKARLRVTRRKLMWPDEDKPYIRALPLTPVPRGVLLHHVQQTIDYAAKDEVCSKRYDCLVRAKWLKQTALPFLSKEGDNEPVWPCQGMGEAESLLPYLANGRFCCLNDEKVLFSRFGRRLNLGTDEGKKRLQLRLQEFVISGMCECCQIKAMEDSDGGFYVTNKE